MNYCLACILVIAFCHFFGSQLRSVLCDPLVKTRRRRDAAACVQRCDRIFERSLHRMGENRETLSALLSKQRPLQQTKDACWKSFDYMDCMQHCELPNRYQLAKASRMLKSKCRPFIDGEEPQLACISRFHSFLEVRCSTYLNEAVRLSKLGVKMKHETCRHLHYHGSCLANNIFHFCPKANRIFTRLRLRDYFISFILPEDDRYFSEDFLDDCQIYDFVKAAEAVHDSAEEGAIDSTKSYLKMNEDDQVSHFTHPDQLLDDAYSTTSTTPIPPTQNAWTAAAKSLETVTPTTTKKMLFSPDRDLQFTPPNFFYSSLRSSSRRRTTQGDLYTNDASDEVDLDVVTLPIRVFTHGLDDHSDEVHEQRSLETFYTSALPRVSASHPRGQENWSPTIPPLPSKATDSEIVSSAERTEMTQKRENFDGVSNSLNTLYSATESPYLRSTLSAESSPWSQRISITASRQPIEWPTSSEQEPKAITDERRSEQRQHATMHRSVADELDHVYASVIKITPNPATVSPKGNIYTDLEYDSDESDDDDESSDAGTRLHISTYGAPNVASEVIHDSSPFGTHPSVIEHSISIPTTVTEYGEVVYVHKADAQLAHTSPSARDLTLSPWITTDTTLRENLIEATDQLQHQQTIALDALATEGRQRSIVSKDVSDAHLETTHAWDHSNDTSTSVHHPNDLSPNHISNGEVERDHYADVAKSSPLDSGYALHNPPLYPEGTSARTENTALDPTQLSATNDRTTAFVQHSLSEERKLTASNLHHSDLTKRPPMFGGRRIHIKPIRSWKEPISDENAGVARIVKYLSPIANAVVVGAWKSSHEGSFSGETLRKRAKPSAERTHESPSMERDRWDLIYKASPNRHLGGHSEILRSDYDEDLRLPETGFTGNGDIWDKSITSQTQNETVGAQGDGGFEDFLPTGHSAVMLFIYGTLASVALLTVIALLIALAVRRYFA
ncbi:hypothetical protein Tcan_08631 [Toxocara canis]|uniref:Chondroitin proteoglycan 4 domain-containing protein n=1 Tax=Toxocara canis TaxID=6265 RepID=A0A0B2W3C7_TOXCA|nr:hypothetical protein Tcan_08631 [Toxocara canis]